MIDKLKEYIRRKIYRRYNIGFSKSGEDMQLKQLLKVDRKGVYVDIGYWDPIKASNSYYFHLRGWKGICIDPNPKMQELFKLKRKKDIFVNNAVGLGNEKLTYYMLEDALSSMNTLDYGFIQLHKSEDKIIEKKEIRTVSLKEILERYIEEGETIDFLDIDVEGFDLDVLKSNDWIKFRPSVILIESDNSIKEDWSGLITVFLEEVNYELVGKSIIQGNLGDLFFINKN